MPAIYEELRSLAGRLMSGERDDHTLQPTALVHETYLRMRSSEIDAIDPLHFRALAARVMRHVLVDHARRYRYQKREGERGKVQLSEGLVSVDRSWADLIALDRALETLGEVDGRKARVIELRFFAGLSIKEIAEALDVSVRTVIYDTRAASAWLRATLEKAAR